ncbi:MAG: NAD(P)/FAD-dependent oxidoreductase [Rhodospirillaceae bacterium]|nr:NAD(P)/FAD-dependent oxidoreductase [Rhodospirillaceae bacterium]
MAPLSRRHLIGASTTALALATSKARAQHKADVIILGAGLAGLNAALLLEELGAKVTVLEGTDRIGGRLFTASASDIPGAPEMGGSGIGANYARLVDAADKYGVKLVPQRLRTEPRPGELMYHLYGQAIKLDEWATHPRNPFPAAEKKIPAHLYQFTYYTKDNPLPDIESWQDPKFAQWDISTHEFLKRKGVPDEAIRLGVGTNLSYGYSEYDMSVLMHFQIDKVIQMSAALGTGGGARAGEGGNQRIPEAMARAVKSEIQMKTHVIAIREDKDGVDVEARDGRTWRAKYLISSLPVSALRLVRIEPGLTGLQAEGVAGLDYTPVFQVHFVPTKKYWEMDGLPPSMWTDRAPGRFMALKNNSADPNEVTTCLSFVNGAMAKFMDRLAPEDAVDFILRELADMRPSTKGALRHVKTWSWNRNVFAGGAYAYWQPGQITRFARDLGKPRGWLHFAGEHTAVTNRGMEGAMESGERAALEVAARL